MEKLDRKMKKKTAIIKPIKEIISIYFSIQITYNYLTCTQIIF